MSHAAPAGHPDSDLEFVRTFQRLVGAVFRLNGQLLDTAASLSADLNISTTRWQAIAAIRNQPLTVPQIARRIGISRQSARQSIQHMEDSGIVRLRDNPDHARSSLVELTADGREKMDILRDRQIQLTQRFTKGTGMSSADIEELTEQLEKLRTHAEELTSAPTET